MKKLLFITMLLGALYSIECEDVNAEYGTNFNCDCNEETWQEYYSLGDMERCWLGGANLSGAVLDEANLSGAYLEGACLEGAIGFTQTNYSGTPILEGCASGDCSFEDTDADGYDDASFEEGYILGSTTGDMNLDGEVNIVDIVIHVNLVLYGE